MLKAGPLSRYQVLKKQCENLIRHKHTLLRKGKQAINMSKLILLPKKRFCPSKNILSPQEVSIASHYQPEMTIQEDSGSPDFKSRPQTPSPLMTSTESQVPRYIFQQTKCHFNSSTLTILVIADVQTRAMLEVQFSRLKQIHSTPKFLS